MKSFKYTSFESFSTLDGPGIRSVLFLASCPYRCIYCHNPETFCSGFYKEMSFEDLNNRYEQNRCYYNETGGITFSGGEPLVQAALINEFLDCGRSKNVGLETAGSLINPEVIKLLDRLNFIYIDLKWRDEDDYQEYSLGSLKKTLDFIFLVRQKNIPAILRHVVVPGINDNSDYLEDICRLTKAAEMSKIEFLPFHNMAAEKYHDLGLDYRLKNLDSLSKNWLEEEKKKLRSTISDLTII